MAGVLDNVSPLSVADAGLGILQTGIGIIDSFGAKKRQAAFHFPSCVFLILAGGISLMKFSPSIL